MNVSQKYKFKNYQQNSYRLNSAIYKKYYNTMAKGDTQDWLNIKNPTNVKYHINVWPKTQYHLNRCKKRAIWQNPTLTPDKYSQQYLKIFNLINSILEKPTYLMMKYWMLNGKTSYVVVKYLMFSRKTVNKQECVLLHLSSTFVLEILASVVRHEINKKYLNWIERSKTVFILRQYILYIENLKQLTHMGWKNTRSKKHIQLVWRMKDQYIKLTLFLNTSNEQYINEINKIIPFIIAWKRKNT